jgi:hypothetical protein
LHPTKVCSPLSQQFLSSSPYSYALALDQMYTLCI